MPETTESRVRQVLAETCLISTGPEVLGTSRLVEDLGCDSLDKIEFAMGLEEQFDITITDEQMEDMETLQQAVALVEKLRTHGNHG